MLVCYCDLNQDKITSLSKLMQKNMLIPKAWHTFSYHQSYEMWNLIVIWKGSLGFYSWPLLHLIFRISSNLSLFSVWVCVALKKSRTAIVRWIIFLLLAETNQNFNILLLQPLSKVLEGQGQFLSLKDIWVSDQEMNMSQEFRIPAVISWYFHFDVLNNSGHITVCIRPQHFKLCKSRGTFNLKVNNINI